MKRLFYIGTIAYCGGLLILQHLPAMAGSTGIKESGPWLLAMVADAVLAVATFVKLVGPEKLMAMTKSENEDDVGFELSDIVIPDNYFYPVIMGWGGLHLLMNGYAAAMSDIGGSVWWGGWTLIDVAVVGIAWLFLRHLKAVLARKQNATPRRVA